MGWRARITALYLWAKVSIGPPKGIALHDPTAMAQGIYRWLWIGVSGRVDLRLAVEQILLIWL